ncbi:MAG: flavin reductase family protein [Alphaproteobacteria bacterium]|nr:flavin reductase family protein [Alphaproteobacteria bacterium]
MATDDKSGAKTIDPGSFWRAIGQRATGATIVTAASRDGPAGLLALSATHVTADPPTMLVSIDNKTSALAGVLEAEHFAINFLPQGAEDVVDLFSGKSALKGTDRFETGRWGTLTTGAPTYNDAIGVIDCTLEEVIERHGVSIVLGRVVDYRADADGTPLVYFRGGYLA